MNMTNASVTCLSLPEKVTLVRKVRAVVSLIFFIHMPWNSRGWQEHVPEKTGIDFQGNPTVLKPSHLLIRNVSLVSIKYLTKAGQK